MTTRMLLLPRAARATAAWAALGLGACGSLAPGQAPGASAADARVAVPARWAAAERAPAAAARPTSPTATAAVSAAPASAASLASTAGSPAADADAPWWARFGDPLLAPLVTQALAAATDAAVARARLEQARARRDLASAARWPSLSLGGSVQRSAAEQRATSGSAELGLDASWTPDLGGGARAALAAAEASLDAQAATLAATRAGLATEVALQLLQWRSARQRLDIARTNLASQQQTLQIVRWRHEAGLVGALDVQQALTAVSQTQAQIPPLETGAAQALHSLAVLTGQPAGSLSLADSPPPGEPAPLPLALPADVLRQRPDVRAAEARLRAAAEGVSEAQAQRLPSLRLGGSIGLLASSLSGLGPGSAAASLAASVTLPVFDAGRIDAQVRVQQGAWAEAQAAYRATVLEALREVEDRLVAEAHLREQSRSLLAAVESARASALLAAQRYASGLIDFQTVLQSQRTLLAAEDSAATTAAAVRAAQVRLRSALGGGWPFDDPLPANPVTP